MGFLKTTCFFICLILTGCSSLQVKWPSGYHPVAFNGTETKQTGSDTLPEIIGSTTGFLAGQPWQVPGGWLIPTTRGRLVVLDTSDLSFGSELRLPGSMDHPGLMDGPVWWGAGAKTGEGWVASVDLRSGTMKKTSYPVPVSPACQDEKFLYVFSDDQRLMAIDKQTLKTVWKTWIAPPDRWIWSGLRDSTSLMVISRSGKLSRVNRETGRSDPAGQLPGAVDRMVWQSGDTLVFAGPDHDLVVLPGWEKPAFSPGRAALLTGNLTRSGQTLIGVGPTGDLHHLSLTDWHLTRASGSDPTVRQVTAGPSGLILAGTGDFLILIRRDPSTTRLKIQLPGRPVSPVLPAGRYRVVQLANQDWIALKDQP